MRMHQIPEKLIVDAETHFRDAEAYMPEIGYPVLENHRHEHEQLVQKVRRFQRRLEMERISMPVVEFLINWVGHHIMTSDREIGRYARGRSGAEVEDEATSPAGSSL